MIVATLDGRTSKAVIDRLRTLPVSFGPEEILPEVRIDLLDDPAPEFLVATERRVLITCRRPSDGGAFRGSEEERLRLLTRAAALSHHLVDVEIDVLARQGDLRPERLVASHHDLVSMPRDVAALRDAALRHRPAFVKIVATARTLRDLVSIADFQAEAPDTAFFSLGELGLVTRLLFRRLGAPVAYVAADRPVAPGQPALGDLDRLHARGSGLPPRPRLYALLGNPTSQSLGPVAWNLAFRELGIDATYVTMPVPGIDAIDCFAESYGACGFSVTAPHKTAALALCLDTDAIAARVGAANTLLRSGAGAGRAFRAFNTDVAGFGAVLDSHPAPAPPEDGRRPAALVVGAGGAARAAVAALLERGCAVTVGSRAGVRPPEWPETLPVEFRTIPFVSGNGYSFLVNATPAGGPGDPEACAVPESLLRKGQIVVDMNVLPPVTQLLRAARRAGAVAVGGFLMWIEQAVRQWAIFLPDRPDGPAVLRRCAAWALRERSPTSS